MILQARGLEKYFGQQAALRQVDLTLEPGIVAILGPNGAGKSTLLRCLATVLRPDAGTIHFEGCSYARKGAAVRARLGYLPQELQFPETLTPARLLAYLARLKDVADTEVDRVLDAFAIRALRDRLFARLSGGQVRLVGMAQAFLGAPHLLVLDEPLRGLDVSERSAVLRQWRAQPPGTLILFSTHLPEDVEAIADQVVLLAEGRVRFVGNPISSPDPEQANLVVFSLDK